MDRNDYGDLGNLRVSLDSRLVQPGDYFVPVVGEEDDGHKYVEDAKKRGAAGSIEEEELYQLAREKLGKINPEVIAVTGSVGKTTMREFIAAILATKYQVTKGTLNTKLGLASNIINDVWEGTEIFVAETGMDKIGELKETGEFIKPQVAVVTNISESHMEKLGSIDKIIEAKSEILQVLPTEGVAFLNWENQYIRQIAKLAPNVISYGLENGEVTQRVLPDNLPIIGGHNRLNAVGACAVGKYFGLSLDELNTGLSRLRSPKGRLSKLEGINASIIFDDTYNSSPVSAIYALESVAEYHSKNNLNGRKVVVLGGMLELGDYEDVGHCIVGEKVVELGYDVVVLVGGLAEKFLKGIKKPRSTRLAEGRVQKIKIYETEDPVEAGRLVKTQIRPQAGDAVLVKASQGVRLEKTVGQLLRDPSRASELLVRQDARWGRW